MILRNLSLLVLANDVHISFEAVRHDIQDIAVLKVDVQKNDYHVVQYVGSEACMNEGVLERVIDECIDKIREYEKAKKQYKEAMKNG